MAAQLMMKKILIVEDELQYARLLRYALNDKFDVTIAREANHGLELAKELRPDLILLDLSMPGTNGLEMLEQLRAGDYGKDARVIVLTNLEPSQQIIREIIQHRPLYYWIKCDTPFQQLVDEITRVCNVT